jgi:hypothetical protein
MKEEKALVNRVDESGIITLDLADFFPTEEIEEIDLKKFLVKELVLMEKHFREELKKIDWNTYRSKTVAVHCSNDAIIPMWAYMLVASYLEPFAKKIFYGNKNQAEAKLLADNIDTLDASEYAGARIVIKGCGDKPLPPHAYMLITKKLQPVVQSLMYGEPCSTVPVYKRPKTP